MAYLTAAYLEAMIGTAEVAALWPAADLSPSIEAATSLVEGALQSGGYTTQTPSTVYLSDASNCPASIKTLALSAWKKIAYERHGLLTQMTGDEWAAYRQINDVRDGLVELPGLSRSVARSMGGISSTSRVDSPRVFGNMRTR